MSNYHSDALLCANVMEHLSEAREHFDNDHIVGIFYQGSGNYDLDYEYSDVDTKLIVTPTLEDLVFNKKAISTTHIRANEEHIDFKDIRLYVETFRKQNLNFLEILFTKYKWINPLYEQAWRRLILYREEIAHLNEYLAVKAMQGVAKEKYFALEHPYPSKMDILAKWGYDPKQLHHLFRIEEFIERYIKGESFEDCLKSKNTDWLVEVKKGLYSIEIARPLAENSLAHVDEMSHKFFDTHGNKINEETDAILREVQYDIIHKSISKDFEKED